MLHVVGESLARQRVEGWQSGWERHADAVSSASFFPTLFNCVL